MADKKISALTAATTPLAGTELVPIVQSSATKQVPVSDLTTGRAISVLDLTATGLTASRAVATDANKKLVSVVNTGTGNNVLASNPTLDGGTNSTHVTIGNTGGRKVTVSTSANSIYDDAWLTFAYNSSVGGYKFTNTVATLLTLDSGGNVTVNTGNLVIGTSGKGIDFSATANGSGTMSSELLADYEEGTWTPTVTSGSGSFTTITAATCSYTKIGNLVTVQAKFTVTAIGTASGSMTVSGLPYTASSYYEQRPFLCRRINDGVSLFGQISGTTLADIRKVDYTAAIIDGYIYTMSASYTV